jgi:hypothetical protein
MHGPSENGAGHPWADQVFLGLVEVRDEVFPFLPTDLLWRTIAVHRNEEKPPPASLLLEEALHAFHQGIR